MSSSVVVQIADMKMARQSGTLITYALGSCVGITLYDPKIKLGAMLHVILPLSQKPVEEHPHKFADTGIKSMLRKMAIMGGNKRNYVCKIAGGAKMFQTFDTSTLGNIGQRNIDAVKQVLRAEGISVSGTDVGGSMARTMSLDLDSGVVNIRCMGNKTYNI